MPQRRRCSIVRALVVLARGRNGSSSVRGSTTSTSIPRRPSSIAAGSPLGPPPTTSTGTRAGTSVIGSPVFGGRCAGAGSAALDAFSAWVAALTLPYPVAIGREGNAVFPDRSVPLLPLAHPGPAVVVAVRGAQHGVD